MTGYQFGESASTSQDFHNLSRIGRTRAHLTQEQWAEAVGVSTRSIVDYEAGVKIPSAATVLRMAEVAEMPVLCYWHMRQSLEYAGAMLPPVEQLSLPHSVVVLLRELRKLEKANVADRLLDMAEDGVIDTMERPDFDAVCGQLRDLIQAAALVTFAEMEGEK